jgi:integrase
MQELVKIGDPGFERLKLLVLDAMPSPNSRRLYDQALEDFFLWWFNQGRPVFSKAVVQAYRRELEDRKLSASTINVRLSALRKLATEAADNGHLAPETAAAIGRVKGVKKLGIRVGNWLELKQARELLAAPDASLLGKRDRAILAVFLGCALRRHELAALQYEQIQQRDGRWVFPDLRGKGGRIRTVPIPAWVKVALDTWIEAAGIKDGPLWLSFTKARQVRGRGLNAGTLWKIIRQYAAAVGLPKLAPHDLRRTCAKLCYKAGGDIEQIQFLLGHSNIKTTQDYLGSKQELVRAPNDLIQL